MTNKQWNSGFMLYIYLIIITNVSSIFFLDDYHAEIWAVYMAVVHLPVILTVMTSEYLKDRKKWKKQEYYQIRL